MNIDSPCINLCQLDDSHICRGCFRSLAEIARWTKMSDAEKAQINLRLAALREKCASAKLGKIA
jgi:predicted Fe-S protein YdhL (DUF1289 family)